MTAGTVSAVMIDASDMNSILGNGTSSSKIWNLGYTANDFLFAIPIGNNVVVVRRQP